LENCSEELFLDCEIPLGKAKHFLPKKEKREACLTLNETTGRMRKWV
jgi:hypothetical protein